ncbi:MAG: amidohydrolase family protein [Chloroflexota bacterium]|nr:amidohydrolase family protein [Chloroflexota bacterium]
MSLSSADLLLVNVRVLTMDPVNPEGEAVAILGNRIRAVGSLADAREMAGHGTPVLDGGGGVAIPAFHDAHLHLLSWARLRAKVDCSGLTSLAELQARIAETGRKEPAGSWIRASGFDDQAMVDADLPDRHILDAAGPDHPVRLQHRGLHLDVLNTRALRLLNLWACGAPEIERDGATGQPTGRLYHAGELLHGRLERAPEMALAADLRQASRQLLAWGVTSVQDASFTNGAAEWELFQRLAAGGALGVRLFMLSGLAHWRELPGASPASEFVRHGPVKVMVNEAAGSDLQRLAMELAAVRASGQALALHAVTEAEVVVALDAIRRLERPAASGPDRLEHASVIADDWIQDIARSGTMVVGQPSLVYERGDHYRREHRPELHGWLHRAGSLVRSGVSYAAGSDAPVTDPAPGLALFGATRRQTRGGSLLGPAEALQPAEILRAMTLAPAAACGATAELGSLRPGRLADITVLDPDMPQMHSAGDSRKPVRLTIMNGRVVWASDGYSR